MTVSPDSVPVLTQAGLATLDAQLKEAWGEIVFQDANFDGAQIQSSMEWVAPRQQMYTTLRDREDGRFIPIYDTEADLRAIRQAGRFMSERVPTAQSIINGLLNYTISKGFDWKITHSSPRIAGLCEAVIKQFCANSKWQEQLEHDSMREEIVDGEFLGQIMVENGEFCLEQQQPDSLTEPVYVREIEEWKEIDVPTSWLYGVCTRKQRTKPLYYHMVYTLTHNDWDVISDDLMVHWKRGVPIAAKRGVTDFYVPHRYLLRADKVLENTAIGSAVQAAIAYFVEHNEKASPSQIESALAKMRGAQVQTIGNQLYTSRKIVAGSRVDLPAGTKYQPSQLGSNSSNIYIAVMEAILRIVGTRYHFPEHMLTGYAGNNNMASALVAESPFVQGRQRDQSIRKHRVIELFKKVLKAFFDGKWARSRNLPCWDDVKHGLEIIVTEPSIVSRDVGTLTTALIAQVEAGITSKRTAAQELGRDYEQEQANIAEDEPEAGGSAGDGVLGETDTGSQAGSDGDAASPPSQQPVGGMSQLNRIQWKRLKQNANEILGELSAGQISSLQAKVFLTNLGLQADQIDELVAAATPQKNVKDSIDIDAVLKAALQSRIKESRADRVKRLRPSKRRQESYCKSIGGRLLEWDESAHPRGKDGKFIGKLSGVDVSNWNQANSCAKWAMNKIGLMEAAAKDNDWEALAQLEHKIKPGTKPNSYQKGVVTAYQNLSALKPQIVELPPQPPVPQGGTWKQLTGALGTQKGGKYLGPDGNEYYVKYPNDPAVAHTEHLSQKLYKLAGSPCVEGEIETINGKTSLATPWKPAAMVDWSDPDMRAKASEDFGVHVWLNNWDAIGLDETNIKMIDGKLTMMDAGGSLDRRATGGLKQFDKDAAKTWKDMMSAGMNPMSAKVFGKMTPQQQYNSLMKVANIDPDHIGELVSKYHGGMPGEKEQAAAILRLRRKRLIEVANELDGMHMGKLSKEYGFKPNAEWVPSMGKDAASSVAAASPALSPNGKPEKIDVPNDQLLVNQKDTEKLVAFVNAIEPTLTTLKSKDPDKIASVLSQHSEPLHKKFVTNNENMSTKKALNILAADLHDKEYGHLHGDVMADVNKLATKPGYAAPVPAPSPVAPTLQTVAAEPKPVVTGGGIPAPPIITSPANQDKAKLIAKLHEAALTGNVEAVKSIPVNENAVNTYAKKVTAYKQSLLAAMGAGAQPNNEVVLNVPKATADVAPKPAAPPTPMQPPKPKVDPELLPSKPTFTSSNAANVEMNNKVADALLTVAKTGELDLLKKAEIPPSPKLKAYHDQLVAAVEGQLASQLPPAKTLDDSLASLVAGIAKSPKAGAKKVGYWAVVHDLNGVPSGVSKGQYQKQGYPGLWEAGAKKYSSLPEANRTAVQDYTTSGYHAINGYLRNGEGGVSAKMKAVAAAQAVREASVPLKEGTMLSRYHGDDMSALQVGHVVSEKGIMSTSTSPEVWSGANKWNITVASGVYGFPVDAVSLNKGEKEVLIPPNSRLLVTAKKPRKDNYQGVGFEFDAVLLPNAHTLNDQ